MSLAARVSLVSRELKIFMVASFVIGIATSMVDATLNNFLNDRFALSAFERSFLEFPRELPGLLVMFTSAVLWFLCSRRLGALTMLLGAIGTFLIGFASTSYVIMIAWLFIYSLGQHTYMPVNTTIGMELSEEGKTGQRLGQLNAIRNIATIAGSFIIFLGFQYLGFTYQNTFGLATISFVVAGILLLNMKPDKPQTAKTFLTLKREYSLYYVLAVLYGSRKQLFMTFAPWVLVQVLHQPTQTLATLMTIGGIIGILFQPLLGWMVDHFGERTVLASEAVLLAVVCLGYGFAKVIFPESDQAAFLLICACYLLDQMLMSVSMARSTYLKKIALRPEDIQPAISAAISIDHVFSISAALLGGLIWNNFGYQYVFLFGTVIAAINFFTVLRIRQPKPA
jgi:predicted MFS family arabinose efflux permease